MAVIWGLFSTDYVSWETNIWPLYGIARWPFFRGSVTVEVYVSSIRTRAFGRYTADGCCTGVAVKRGSPVLEFPGYSDSGKWNSRPSGNSENTPPRNITAATWESPRLII